MENFIPLGFEFIRVQVKVIAILNNYMYCFSLIFMKNLGIKSALENSDCEIRVGR